MKAMKMPPTFSHLVTFFKSIRTAITVRKFNIEEFIQFPFFLASSASLDCRQLPHPTRPPSHSQTVPPSPDAGKPK